MLDNRIEVETPENIIIMLAPAGPIPRILAFSIDFFIRSILVYILYGSVIFLDDIGIALFFICFFLIDWFYSVLFEIYNNGMTPGKRTLNIQVIHDDGTPIQWGSSILRNILRVVDFLPFGYLFGLITMCASPSFKRLGDLAAGTLVIHTTTPDKQPQLNIEGSLNLPFALHTDEQRAIIAFAEREHQLSPSRQSELAAILQPILPTPTASNPTTSAVKQIKQMANGIMGKKQANGE